MKKHLFVSFNLIILLLFAMRVGSGQTTVPDVLYNGSLSDQMKYLDEKTRIYENYRAIREDMYQLIRKNSLDSLAKVKGQVALLAGMNRNLVITNDSLTTILNQAKNGLDQAIKTKNSIKVIGLDVNKNFYNSVMWIIIAALIFLLITGFLAYKRSISISKADRKELEEMKTEFESYRQKTRLEREKMSMDHFNEIRKLKAGK